MKKYKVTERLEKREMVLLEMNNNSNQITVPVPPINWEDFQVGCVIEAKLGKNMINNVVYIQEWRRG